MVSLNMVQCYVPAKLQFQYLCFNISLHIYIYIYIYMYIWCIYIYIICIIVYYNNMLLLLFIIITIFIIIIYIYICVCVPACLMFVAKCHPICFGQQLHRLHPASVNPRPSVAHDSAPTWDPCGKMVISPGKMGDFTRKFVAFVPQKKPWLFLMGKSFMTMKMGIYLMVIYTLVIFVVILMAILMAILACHQP